MKPLGKRVKVPRHIESSLVVAKEKRERERKLAAEPRPAAPKGILREAELSRFTD